MEIDADLHGLLAEQRHELRAGKAAESDLGFAFRLQLQEAIEASLASTSSSSPPRVLLENDAAPVPSLAHLLDEEIANFERSAATAKKSSPRRGGFARAYVEGLTVIAESFKSYFKGMVSVQVVAGVDRKIIEEAGIESLIHPISSPKHSLHMPTFLLEQDQELAPVQNLLGSKCR